MLKQLNLDNLTLFPRERLKFSPGLNVLVGENATGKSHILKSAYGLIAPSASKGGVAGASPPTKGFLQRAYAEKLVGVFRPDTLGRLVSRRQGRGRCEIELKFDDHRLDTRISFATNASNEVKVEELPDRWDESTPIFLPTRELMTLGAGFIALYDSHYVPFEETWRDTCAKLAMPPMKGPRARTPPQLIEEIEKVLGGSIETDKNGRYYLLVPGGGKFEMMLVAEGLRKLAMLAQLARNGTLSPGSYLFWDEPESNLNAKLVKLVAKALIELCRQNIQVFIATHSLFLLRELEILLTAPENADVSREFFGLHRAEGSVRVEQGYDVTEIGDITALEESLLQSDRYLDLE